MHNGAKNDRCKILTKTSPSSTDPEPTSSFSAGSEIRCRFSRTGTREVVDGTAASPVDCEIRVPAGTTVTASDRVRLTKRNGATVSEDYAIVGEPWALKGEIALNCQLLIGNSAR